jgi:hypothetical protein
MINGTINNIELNILAYINLILKSTDHSTFTNENWY